MKIPKKRRDKRLIVFGCCALVALLCFFVIPQLVPGQNVSFDTESVLQLEDWRWQLPDQTEIEISLPTKLPVQAGETVQIVSRLPEELMPGASLCIRTVFESIRIESEGELLYQSGTDPAAYRGSLLGSAWNIARLPEGFAGREVTISLTSPHEKSAGIVNEVLCGSKSALLFYLVNTYAFNLVAAALVFVTGMVLMFLSLLLRNGPIHQSELFYLSLFAMLVALWLAGESKMLQFLTGSHYYVSNLALIALLLLPIPFVLYIERAYQPHGKRLTPIMFWAFTANFVICMMLQFLGIANLFETIKIVQIMILVGMLLVVASLLKETFFWHGKNAAHLLLAQLVLFVSSGVEIGNFYHARLSNLSGTLRIGLMFYIVVLGIDSIHKISLLLEKNREMRSLQRLAYRDLLTGGKNRTAYYEDVQKCFSDAQRATHWLVLFDLNNLKQINDSFGHARGDEALQKAYSCIVTAFVDCNRCYRIGGDEFAAIAPNAGEEIFNQTLQLFHRTVAQQAKSLPYEFSVALGFGRYDGELYQNFEDLSQEVDRRMYVDKMSSKHKNSGANFAQQTSEGGNNESIAERSGGLGL